jgi:hypothetical protein
MMAVSKHAGHVIFYAFAVVFQKRDEDRDSEKREMTTPAPRRDKGDKIFNMVYVFDSMNEQTALMSSSPYFPTIRRLT